MNFEKIIEAVNQCTLPFIYSGERLNEEKCQKAFKKINADTDSIALIASDGLMALEGIAISKTGIKFSLSTGSVGTMNIPKTKGSFPFKDFVIHSVSVDKGLLPKFNVSMVIWDNNKKNSFTFQFGLTQDNLKFEDSMKDELKNIFECLTSKTGTEYTEVNSGLFRLYGGRN